MSASPSPGDEPDAVRARYARREAADARYHPLDAAVLAERQGRERAWRRLLVAHGLADTASLRAIEVGCGDGSGLLDLLRLGFEPAQLAGIELLPARAARARERLPATVQLWQGDATGIDAGDGAWDLVCAATVFSSLLDDAFQQRLADAMWRWLRPGGAVVAYDFAVDNPRNPDVRGMPVARWHQLFPGGPMEVQRLTLAPPLARALGRLHPALITWAGAMPLLRTHRLVWITKPSRPSPEP